MFNFITLFLQAVGLFLKPDAVDDPKLKVDDAQMVKLFNHLELLTEANELLTKAKIKALEEGPYWNMDDFQNKVQAFYWRLNKKIVQLLPTLQLQTRNVDPKKIYQLVISSDSKEIYLFMLNIFPLSEEILFEHANIAIKLKSVETLGVIIKTMTNITSNEVMGLLWPLLSKGREYNPDSNLVVAILLNLSIEERDYIQLVLEEVSHLW